MSKNEHLINLEPGKCKDIAETNAYWKKQKKKQKTKIKIQNQKQKQKLLHLKNLTNDILRKWIETRMEYNSSLLDRCVSVWQSNLRGPGIP